MSAAWVSMLSALEYERTSTRRPDSDADCSNFTADDAWKTCTFCLDSQKLRATTARVAITMITRRRRTIIQ